MALAHLVGSNTYDRAYKDITNRKLIIIDNGEAEGAQVSNYDLIVAAQAIGATEIVVPDVIRNHQETCERTEKFFKEFPDLQRFDYMGVAQGSNLDEIKECIEFFANESRITTLGIPRWTIGSLYHTVRMDLVLWTVGEFPDRFNIHLLGTSPKWVTELYYVGKYLQDQVRSCDTSMPFNYGLANVHLRKDTVEQIARPKDYFEKSFSHLINEGVFRRNIATMRRWARGEW